MHATATTDHATAHPANFVTDDPALAAHQITIEHTFETAHRLAHLEGASVCLEVPGGSRCG